MAGERVSEPPMAISQLRAELRGLNPPPPASGTYTAETRPALIERNQTDRLNHCAAA